VDFKIETNCFKIYAEGVRGVMCDICFVSALGLLPPIFGALTALGILMRMDATVECDNWELNSSVMDCALCNGLEIRSLKG